MLLLLASAAPGHFQLLADTTKKAGALLFSFCFSCLLCARLLALLFSRLDSNASI
jgi:hypothetical protein